MSQVVLFRTLRTTGATVGGATLTLVKYDIVDTILAPLQALKTTCTLKMLRRSFWRRRNEAARALVLYAVKTPLR